MAFRLVTLNVNGIRSAASKGWVEWAQNTGADCMGVQEIKAHAADLHGRLDKVAGLNGHFHCAQKKGYSGVGLFVKKDPSAVITGFGNEEFDAEGRWVETRYDTASRKLSLISCYFPSGSAGEHRQAAKFRFLAALYPHLMRLKAEREFILVGDVNIAHQAIDLKNWRSNQKNSGFTPDERAWLTRLLTDGGLVDVFRTLNPHPEQLHLVEQPRPGLGQERRLAHRLPPGHARHRCQGPGRAHLPGSTFLGPRAAARGLRLHAVEPWPYHANKTETSR